MMDDSTRMVAKRRGGQPGNQNGARHKMLRSVLVDVLNSDNQETLRKGLLAIYKIAGTGDLDAMAWIFDRCDGRPKQAVDVASEMKTTIDVVPRPQITREEWLALYGPKTIEAEAWRLPGG